MRRRTTQLMLFDACRKNTSREFIYRILCGCGEAFSWHVKASRISLRSYWFSLNTIPNIIIKYHNIIIIINNNNNNS
jgi:hypothetical protein